tara:strand:- start:1045 stop:1326 length:282 start_codon:yes stop_codon:yes gene_type:complete
LVQSNGRIKKTNNKNKTAHNTPMSNGYNKIPPFALGFNECAIKPWVPMLNRVKMSPEITMIKVSECDSLMENSKNPDPIEKMIKILYTRLAIG